MTDGGTPEARVMATGLIKWFDPKKGYGFIAGSEEGKDIFVHYTSIQGTGFRSLRDGERVEYELVKSEKGLQARDVRPVAEKAPKAKKKSS
jgi:CspA family cold shock protein